MDRPELETLFDEQAANYDTQWLKLRALQEGLHLLMASAFSSLPDDARLLCVGAGTGAEIHHLATRFPGWTFVAVEPSSGMVSAAQARAAQHGYASRCHFHTGYLETLADAAAFDCATTILVSQFQLDPAARVAFFRDIAARLRPGGVLFSADLSGDTQSMQYATLLDIWYRTMAAGDLPASRLQQMREAYERDVAILPPDAVEALIASAGFDAPVRLYQAGLIHGWCARRAPT